MLRKKIVVFVIAALFVSSIALANGLNLNGFGARAAAMGGAFVGLADDFTSIFWNPAGMALAGKKTFGFTGDVIIPSGTYSMEMFGMTLVDSKTKSNIYPAGLVSYFHPITESLTAGIGVYSPSGIGAEWPGMDFAAISNGAPYKWESFIGVISISPGLAYKINEQFYVGATLNINYGIFKMSQHAGEATVPIPIPPYSATFDLGQFEESSTGWGLGATFGVLVKPSEMFSLGATLRTPNKINFSGDTKISKLSTMGFPNESGFEREVTSPMWIAGGVAFNPTPELTITADAQYTDWKKIDVLKAEYTDPIFQAFLQAGGSDEMEMHWESKMQLRFGAEYRFGDLAVRGGYYWDPSPAPNKTMNVLIPSFDFNAITLGVGYARNGFNLDFGLEYLMGADRDIELNDVNRQPGFYSFKVVVPMISISYGW